MGTLLNQNETINVKRLAFVSLVLTSAAAGLGFKSKFRHKSEFI